MLVWEGLEEEDLTAVPYIQKKLIHSISLFWDYLAFGYFKRSLFISIVPVYVGSLEKNI